MKHVVTVLGIAVILGVGWYLGSPLLIDTVVHEELHVLEDTEPVVPLKEMMEKMETLTAEEVDSMSKDERDALQVSMNMLAKEMPDTVMKEDMGDEDSSPRVIAEGEFQDADSFHQGSGDARVYRLQDRSTLVRFENFSVTNGPALSVFLTKTTDGTRGDDAVNLGKLKGNKGNQNYKVPDDIDITEYSSVLIYCVPFRVPFAYAVIGEEE